MADLDLMLRFMLQVLVVLVACRVLGWFGKKYLGQAQATMEMLTGIVLGPSLFGVIFPKVQQYVFPPFVVADHPLSGKSPSMSVLYVIAQIGLVLYIFLVGLEFDGSLVKNHTRALKTVSMASIGFPIIVGFIVFYTVLRSRSDLFGPGISDPILAMFVGAALCITAFPTLARIIQESGLSGTSLGTVTIVAGAISDVVAWILLAVILSFCKGNPLIAVWAIGGGIAFSLIVLTAGRQLFSRLGPSGSDHGSVSNTTFGLVLMALFAGAWISDAIGVYAVFGAFIVGVAMPRGQLAIDLRSRIESLTLTLFLPFFFVVSGLSTKIGSLATIDHWLIFALMLFIAIVVKIGGCYFAARIGGESKLQSLVIGVFMNTRGLMELVLLNIGLQQKIISPVFFSMMVLVAVVTTMMTAPIVKRISRDGLLESV